MQPRCVDSGARFSTTASGTVHTRQPREPTREERARLRAWLWRFVRQIKAPIIYIVGGRSTIVPVATQEELKKALPQAQIVTIPGVGHYPSEENEKDYLTIVDKFLSGK